MNCTDHDYQFVKQKKSNGSFMVKKQCTNCGRSDAHQYKFEEAGGRNKVILLPDFDEDKLQQFYTDQQKARQAEWQEQQKEWFVGYNQYLRSDAWKSKRERVLKRDNNLCQACLKAIATEIHHLTYRHVFNEPLFDLVAICNPCHVKITKMEREDRNV